MAGLQQGANQRPFAEFRFVVVAVVSSSVSEGGFGRTPGCGLLKGAALERGLCLPRPPWLGRDAAKRNPRLVDPSFKEVESDRSRSQCKLVGLAITDL